MLFWGSQGVLLGLMWFLPSPSIEHLAVTDTLKDDATLRLAIHRSVESTPDYTR